MFQFFILTGTHAIFPANTINRATVGEWVDQFAAQSRVARSGHDADDTRDADQSFRPLASMTLYMSGFGGDGADPESVGNFKKRLSQLEQKYTNYGCYCWVNGAAAGVVGKGASQDATDAQCKDLYQCYKCVQIDYSQTYNDVSYTVNFTTNKDGSRVLDCSKNKDKAAKSLCECDKRFAANVGQSDSTTIIDESYRTTNGDGNFNPQSQCSGSGNGGSGNALPEKNQCCGGYPGRVPYDNSSKVCCLQRKSNMEVYNLLSSSKTCDKEGGVVCDSASCDFNELAGEGYQEVEQVLEPLQVLEKPAMEVTMEAVEAPIYTATYIEPETEGYVSNGGGSMYMDNGGNDYWGECECKLKDPSKIADDIYTMAQCLPAQSYCAQYNECMTTPGPCQLCEPENGANKPPSVNQVCGTWSNWNAWSDCSADYSVTITDNVYYNPSGNPAGPQNGPGYVTTHFEVEANKRPKSVKVQAYNPATGIVDSTAYPLVPSLITNRYVPNKNAATDPYVPYVATTTVIKSPTVTGGTLDGETPIHVIGKDMATGLDMDIFRGAPLACNGGRGVKTKYREFFWADGLTGQGQNTKVNIHLCF